jgi:uncharacterized protein (TIGR02145 family)
VFEIKKINMKYIYISLITTLVLSSCKKSSPSIATISTNDVTSITGTTATSGGNVTTDGGNGVTERGICYSTTHSPTINNTKISNGSGTGTFVITLTGLVNNTTYYIRAYAINDAGIGYGQEVSFTTDFESISIGAQTWMKRNLDVSKYRNGDTIPQVTDAATWASLTTGAWCYYNNDPANGQTYGKLYNWYAVNDSRNLAPAGWHIPAYGTELYDLINFLGGNVVAGSLLKETGTSHWNSPNTDATNSSGFTALPGGFRSYDGTFSGKADLGNWWSATENFFLVSTAWFCPLVKDNGSANLNFFNKSAGFSIRCIKD